MKIVKTGFYKLLENEEENIFIWDNINVFIYDEKNIIKNIEVWNNSTLEYYGYFSEEWTYEKNIIVSWEKSNVKIKSLVNSNNNKLYLKFYWNIKKSYSSIDMKILAFAWNKWNINIDWILDIDSSTKWWVWHLKQENIFLWDNAKISWIPTLLVKTNDVEASHSCTMERISDENLFYLRSRWVEKEDSLQMIIEAKIIDLFRCLDMVDKELFEKLTVLKKSS